MDKHLASVTLSFFFFCDFPKLLLVKDDEWADWGETPQTSSSNDNNNKTEKNEVHLTDNQNNNKKKWCPKEIGGTGGKKPLGERKFLSSVSSPQSNQKKKIIHDSLN